MSFEARGFTLCAIFDKNPALIGENIRGITIQSITELEHFCKDCKIDMAVLCVPQDSVAELADRIYS